MVKGYEMGYRLINRYFQNINEIWGSEVSLYYPEKYAGTTDLVGVYRDKPAIIDFKQSNKPKREEWITDYYYQIAAYSLAHKKNYGPITQGMISICTKDKLYQGFRMNEDKLKEYEDKWFKRVEEYNKINRNSA